MASKEHKPMKKIKGAVIGGKSGFAGHHGKSKIWDEFDKIKDAETEKWTGDCKCKHCNAVIYSPSQIGTNKLWTHIGHCKEIPVELKDKKQTIVNIFDGAMVNWRFNQEKCRRACAVMVIVAELPFWKKGNNVRDEIRARLKRKNSVDSLNDLERYLNDGIEEGGPDFDILLWWKGKSATYRAVAIMARDILSIPITSVASENAFSGAGRVLDPFRSSLTPKLVEALVCAQDWLRGGSDIGVDIEIEEDIETLVQLEKISNFSN
ncbi:hypothetical protein CASFOL_000543 [Castilleja foliolosa]|uniref:HAT C-terminal dimerisation domain-containing protein n=1 Tax=Castilleja foliolosa TaxID=1961234 RepID=A0ABD3ELX1_9LAMI